MQVRQSVGEYVTVRGIAKERGIDFPTLYKHIKTHNVPHILVGNVLMVKPVDVASYQPRQYKRA